MSETQTGHRYRLLTQGEAIQVGDQHLSDDAETWSAVPPHACGMAYRPAVLMPVRRPLQEPSNDR